MLSKLFGKTRAHTTAPANGPTGERVYAIGDIHGRLDLLDELIERIFRDERERHGMPSTIIFLGDLIDRGPESAQVVERVMQFETQRPTRFLLGNHEEVFLKSLDGDLTALALFNRIGGRETALSYGISEEEYRKSDYPALANLLARAVPRSHIDFMNRFEDLIVLGDYAFVHAGVRPNEPLTRQRPSDLRWIRNEFLRHQTRLEKMIVHGHTISDDVEFGPHRIGIDTGAYMSGKLTAMGIEGSERWLLQTG
ncbi:serine/threonine protein phosphatase [Sphingomonas sp. CBMAI 2297]|uniref:metallophosphoesterase family protein n=1 Tax=Sphingomonas sp. CBMAI 2297 TaxID=2991720 RepID=UPI002458ADF5|nr:metallophosphoesterase family protein [Sphingomonas sp. CBMAI 2297]MDH4743002.1 serine/threonine protein phosphatase [Sphingomonas sp. CBMAI 2297]